MNETLLTILWMVGIVCGVVGIIFLEWGKRDKKNTEEKRRRKMKKEENEGKQTKKTASCNYRGGIQEIKYNFYL